MAPVSMPQAPTSTTRCNPKRLRSGRLPFSGRVEPSNTTAIRCGAQPDLQGAALAVQAVPAARQRAACPSGVRSYMSVSLVAARQAMLDTPLRRRSDRCVGSVSSTAPTPGFGRGWRPRSPGSGPSWPVAGVVTRRHHGDARSRSRTSDERVHRAPEGADRGDGRGGTAQAEAGLELTGFAFEQLCTRSIRTGRWEMLPAMLDLAVGRKVLRTHGRWCFCSRVVDGYMDSADSGRHRDQYNDRALKSLPSLLVATTLHFESAEKPSNSRRATNKPFALWNFGLT